MDDVTKANVQGALDRDIIRRIVRAHINEVRACYNAELTRDPNAKGTSKIQWTIGPDGKVTELKVEEGSSLNDEGLNACITEKVKGLDFPKPASGEPTTLPFPFNLEPG